LSIATGGAAPGITKVDSQHGLVWTRESQEVQYVRVIRPAADRQRHKRKYAVGQLGDDRSFYFRGPEGKLNLRAQNLVLFLQLADGVDDQTWEFHLRRGDYSAWFRDAIKDSELAGEAEQIEQNLALDPRLSRNAVRNAIQQRYAAPP
jgi:hypothetical protein